MLPKDDIMRFRGQLRGKLIEPGDAAYQEARKVYNDDQHANLADYHLPVNADIGAIDLSALDIPDFKVDILGARGIGEIGITGTGAAVANAIFHATGRRIRDPSDHPGQTAVRWTVVQDA